MFARCAESDERDVYETARPTTEAGAVRRCKRFFCNSQLDSARPVTVGYGSQARKAKGSGTALVISALAPLVIDQVTSEV